MVNSELQKAATKTVILEMSDAPVMVVDPPAARSTEDAIVISTATASSTGVGVGDTVVHINDPGTSTIQRDNRIKTTTDMDQDQLHGMKSN